LFLSCISTYLLKGQGPGLVNVLWARASKHVFVVKATLAHPHTCNSEIATSGGGEAVGGVWAYGHQLARFMHRFFRGSGSTGPGRSRTRKTEPGRLRRGPHPPPRSAPASRRRHLHWCPTLRHLRQAKARHRTQNLRRPHGLRRARPAPRGPSAGRAARRRYPQKHCAG